MSNENQFDIQYCPFVVDETPYCLWDDDLARLNMEYLKQIDPMYFSQIAQTLAPLLDGESKQYAATILRSTYSHGLETLFAMLGAFVQAPDCPAGWILKYTNRELYSVTRKIHEGQSVHHRLNLPQITWETIAQAIFGFQTGDAERDAARSQAFASLWGRLAHEFINAYFSEEYNSIKHGFRIGMGGFDLTFGPRPDSMRQIAASPFGTAYFMPHPIHDKNNFHLVEYKRNWNPYKFVFALQLIGMSIVNVINAMKAVAGVPLVELEFPEPDNYGFIEALDQFDADFASVRYSPGFEPDDPAALAKSKSDILASYNTARPSAPQNAEL